MREIVFENEHRRKHFEFFRACEQPHFNVCASVDVSNFREWQKREGLPFNISMVYFVTTCAHQIPEFRWRIRESRVVEHEVIRPSFTVPTDCSDVFSFCTVNFYSDYETFVRESKKMQERMRTDPSFEDEPGCDDYFFFSSLPWIHFTSVSHAMGQPAKDSIPRITWGRLEERDGKVLMPLSVQAHHALVDGRHMGELFQKLEAALAEPEAFSAPTQSGMTS